MELGIGILAVGFFILAGINRSNSGEEVDERPSDEFGYKRPSDFDMGRNIPAEDLPPMYEVKTVDDIDY